MQRFAVASPPVSWGVELPPLILFGLNRVMMRPITRRVQWIEQRIGVVAKPRFGLVAYTLGMWVWHAPALYDAASRHDSVHLLEHMTFTSIGFSTGGTCCARSRRATG